MMDTDYKTCGKCKHGNFYDNCPKCEAAAEALRAVRTHTPESVSKLTDDELRLAVARKMFPDQGSYVLCAGKEHVVNEVRIYNATSENDFGGLRGILKDVLSPAGAFKLMVENKITVDIIGDDCFAYADLERLGCAAPKRHPATEHGTARAICEAFLLMGE